MQLLAQTEPIILDPTHTTKSIPALICAFPPNVVLALRRGFG